MRRWLRDERGATAIEYGLIAALVTVVLIAGLNAFSSGATQMFNYIGTSLSTATGTAPSP